LQAATTAPTTAGTAATIRLVLIAPRIDEDGLSGIVPTSAPVTFRKFEYKQFAADIAVGLWPEV
jgi:hypothetical protein